MNDFPQHKQGMSGSQKTLVGCGITALVIIVILIVGGIWAWGMIKVAAADALYAISEQMVDDAQLPEDQKQGVLREIAELRDGFKTGEIGFVQLVTVFEQVMDGPAMAVIVLSGADSKYIQPSGLSDEEKADAQLTIQRFMRGVVENNISDAEATNVWNSITEPTPGATDPTVERQLRTTIPDEELRTILAELKQAADDASVPDEPYTPDVAQELSDAIDRALGR